MNKVTIEIIDGVGGLSLYINDYRVAGSKPYGGGRTVKKWDIDELKLIVAMSKEARAALGEKE